jgi:hypothetical protein
VITYSQAMPIDLFATGLIAIRLRGGAGQLCEKLEVSGSDTVQSLIKVHPRMIAQRKHNSVYFNGVKQLQSLRPLAALLWLEVAQNIKKQCFALLNPAILSNQLVLGYFFISCQL